MKILQEVNKILIQLVVFFQQYIYIYIYIYIYQYQGRIEGASFTSNDVP